MLRPDKFIFILATIFLSFLSTCLAQEGDIVCHTDELEACYPAVFTPTDEFQIVHEDQAIPKGLHVRLNLETGKKEAKLYNPSEDTDDVTAIEVIPEQPVDVEQHADPLADYTQKVLNEMRGTSEASGIKPPPGSSEDARLFEDTMRLLRANIAYLGRSNTDVDVRHHQQLLDAIDVLEDLCHDLYWGLQLVQTPDIPAILFTVILLPHDGSNLEEWADLQGRSARLLGTALQNNKAALDSFESVVTSASINDRTTETFWPALANNLRHESLPPQTALRIIYLVSNMLAHETLLRSFLQESMLWELNLLLQTYQDQGSTPEHARVRSRIANLISDRLIGDGSEQSLFWDDPFYPGLKGIPKPGMGLGFTDTGHFCSSLHKAYDMLTALRVRDAGDHQKVQVSTDLESECRAPIPVGCQDAVARHWPGSRQTNNNQPLTYDYEKLLDQKKEFDNYTAIIKSRNASKEDVRGALWSITTLCRREDYWGERLLQDFNLTARLIALASDVDGESFGNETLPGNKTLTEEAAVRLLSFAAKKNGGAAVDNFATLRLLNDFLNTSHDISSRDFMKRVVQTISSPRTPLSLGAEYGSLLYNLLEYDEFLAEFLAIDGLANVESRINGFKNDEGLLQNLHASRFCHDVERILEDRILRPDTALHRWYVLLGDDGYSGPLGELAVGAGKDHPLEQVLPDRKAVCEMLLRAWEIAHDIPIRIDEKTGQRAKAGADEGKWEQVPPTCNKMRYDLMTGLPLGSNHDEL